MGQRIVLPPPTDASVAKKEITIVGIVFLYKFVLFHLLVHYRRVSYLSDG